MNRKIGFIASITLSGSVAAFLVCLVLDLTVAVGLTSNISYGACILLAWSWVAVTCARACFAEKEKAAAAKIGVAAGVLYAGLVSVVYYTQLTTALYKTADDAVLQALSFTAPGSWLFSLDLLGYALLSLSTLFTGLSLTAANKTDKTLKLLLMLHGLFTVCMLFPMLPLPATNGGVGGIVALIVWCVCFLPICVLSALHFKKEKNAV